jgi:hypothetical protein
MYKFQRKEKEMNFLKEQLKQEMVLTNNLYTNKHSQKIKCLFNCLSQKIYWQKEHCWCN